MQNTSQILMIRPVSFGYNAETAVNNGFQTNSGDAEQIAAKAKEEFDAFVQLLRQNDVNVLVYQDQEEPHTPDSIFPNNWISFHADCSICLFPMFAENRRKERNKEVIDLMQQKFVIQQSIDFSWFEKERQFNEGTGSMVLDRDYKLAFACLSPRTHLKPLRAFCEKMYYAPVTFSAFGSDGSPVYHTNVMMCVADQYVVICMESIRSNEDKKAVREAIAYTNKQLIEISIDQMNRFAGNMLQVIDGKGEKLLVMSKQAFESLTQEQVELLASYNRILYADLNTIETNGGGSARCMMAEIFLPLLDNTGALF